VTTDITPLPRRLLLICGSTRAGSSNFAAVRAVHELDLPGLRTDLFDSLGELPAFVPDQRRRRRPDLHARVRRRTARQSQEPARLDGRRR
jgi:NAD(P)H-dependent FMN reductase